MRCRPSCSGSERADFWRAARQGAAWSRSRRAGRRGRQAWPTLGIALDSPALRDAVAFAPVSPAVQAGADGDTTLPAAGNNGWYAGGAACIASTLGIAGALGRLSHPINARQIAAVTQTKSSFKATFH